MQFSQIPFKLPNGGGRVSPLNKIGCGLDKGPTWAKNCKNSPIPNDEVMLANLSHPKPSSMGCFGGGGHWNSPRAFQSQSLNLEDHCNYEVVIVSSPGNPMTPWF